jgi:hypothetical protein
MENGTNLWLGYKIVGKIDELAITFNVRNKVHDFFWFRIVNWIFVVERKSTLDRRLNTKPSFFCVRFERLGKRPLLV